jgi:type IV pilus assembly protein PilO
MTSADNFASEEIEELETTSQPEYPVVFGIPITPRVGGFLFGGLGIFVAGYLYVTQVQPAQQQYGELRQQQEQKQAQINQPSTQKELKQIEAQLQQAQTRQKQVLDLLSSEQSLDTILVDFNSLIAEINAALGATQEQNKLELVNFQPLSSEATTVQDGSLGSAVNGKVKRKSFELEMKGTFRQIKLMMNSIERLQPLLIVRNFQTEISKEQVVKYRTQGNTIASTNPPRLNTTFQVDAILPLKDS